ncbi:MAG: hypothetical protein A2365_01235 [Candidatus Nealsonbacteria bacterium RIFOXYB1_FULL_40_15]|uniref:Methyltransferase type 11 domain-containing protein n=2 Tax=Candidatus Nealsoniibacteriota TaxID=1817911 RepID=A0A1G2ELJ0_9BACT|nr:MAG: hypothetical protein A2427_04765 [Candidatus Nealsonbacteria bacterium RIFOXYC1_FULL_40_7]OGZ26892.1 MAG: hypothetical protein A2365_01235 [Candidatus Nealsonbacteria bacterium RIFOXYB1_FULL_40_15]OGZ29318.1 MAG: hypothetical protein A2562_01690 [Candidatus Nealsonbacteria bacterium RIFOXYD1_FULL_39_11]
MKKEYAEYLLNKTKADYNLISREFSETRNRLWDEIGFLFYNYLKENESVLDSGCGNGRYYELFREKNINYVGIDNSEELIKIAKEKHPEADFRIGDSLSLPFEDSSFDKVYSIAVLHRIPSYSFRARFLKEAKRVLKKDGYLILTVWKIPNIYKRKSQLLLLKHTLLKLLGISKLDFKDVLEPWGNKTFKYYHWFSKRELKSLLKKSGFKIKEIGAIKNVRGNHRLWRGSAKGGNRQNIYVVAQKVL